VNKAYGSLSSAVIFSFFSWSLGGSCKEKYLAHKVEAADKILHPTTKVNDSEAVFCSPPLRFAVAFRRSAIPDPSFFSVS